MSQHPARPQLGLFDNPVQAFSLDELAETVRALERQQPGRTRASSQRIQPDASRPAVLSDAQS